MCTEYLDHTMVDESLFHTTLQDVVSWLICANVFQVSITMISPAILLCTFIFSLVSIIHYCFSHGHTATRRKIKQWKRKKNLGLASSPVNELSL